MMWKRRLKTEARRPPSPTTYITMYLAQVLMAALKIAALNIPTAPEIMPVHNNEIADSF
jgi:hypothetical protein